MGEADSNRHGREALLLFLAIAGFLWAIYEHYDDRRSILTVKQSIGQSPTPFRYNIFEDRDKYTEETLTVLVTNSGRAPGRDVHVRVQTQTESWVVGVVGYPEFQIEEENGITKDLGSSFRPIPSEPQLLKAHLDKLSPGLQVQLVVAYAHRKDRKVGPPEVLVYDDDGVGR